MGNTQIHTTDYDNCFEKYFILYLKHLSLDNQIIFGKTTNQFNKKIEIIQINNDDNYYNNNFKNYDENLFGKNCVAYFTINGTNTFIGYNIIKKKNFIVICNNFMSLNYYNIIDNQFLNSKKIIYELFPFDIVYSIELLNVNLFIDKNVNLVYFELYYTNNDNMYNVKQIEIIVRAPKNVLTFL